MIARLRRWSGGVLLATALFAGAARAQPLPEPVKLAVYQQQAAAIFDPKAIADADSELSTMTDRLLLLMQGGSVALVVAGMILRIRKDHEQMEGIAAMIVKVAFIATIPLWRTLALETADVAAEAIGYRAATVAGEPSAVMSGMWKLANQWTPAGSPYVDALETQAGQTAPASGEEQAWSLRAWNWARGMGVTTGDQFQAVWQGISGGLRATFVHTGCAALSCAVLLTIFVAYLAEVVRYVLYYGGCALLPVFIAGLGVEAFRRQAVRCILFVATIAGWPIGWALMNLVTRTVTDGALTWAQRTTKLAMDLPEQSANVPTIATVAPFLAWGALILFAALTIVVCLWTVGAVVVAPLVFGRLASSGAQVVTGAMAMWPTAAPLGIAARAGVRPSAFEVRIRGANSGSAAVIASPRHEAAGSLLSRPEVSRLGFVPSAVARQEPVRPAATASSTRDGLPAWLPTPNRLRQTAGPN